MRPGLAARFGPLGRAAACALAGLLAAGCDLSTLNSSESLNPSGWYEAESDLARTFEHAMVLLPGAGGGRPRAVRMRDLAAAAVPSEPLPTVLYLHGCTGLNRLSLLQELARQGFAVVAPDSFARRFRPLQCRPSTRTGGNNLFVYDFRMAEISYALQRMRALDWVDQRRLFLFGTSEGGLAAALYRGDSFQARIIAQWTCHGGSLVRGLAAPPDEPVLAVVADSDPWYDEERTPGQRGHCGAFFGTRPRSQSLLVGDDGHDVLAATAVQRRVLAFLKREAFRTVAGKHHPRCNDAGESSTKC